MKEEFNPQEWLDKAKDPSIPSKTSNSSKDINTEVDKVITRIEAAFTDIATNYSDWLNVGFAFAHEFGEAGRSFYHRVSRFYTGYTKSDTDKQFDQCMKGQGHGITINTFFHLAKQAGIDISTNEAGKEVFSGQRSVGSGKSGQYSVDSENSDQCSVGSDSGYSEGSGQYAENSGKSGQYSVGIGKSGQYSDGRKNSDQCSVGSDSRYSEGSGQYVDDCGNSDQYSDGSNSGYSESIDMNGGDGGDGYPEATMVRDRMGQQGFEEDVSGPPFTPSPPPSLTPSSSPEEEDPPPEEEQPNLPDFIFEQVPEFFKRVVSRADSKEERDMLLLSSIVTVGSCLTTFSGIYDGNQVYPTLFLYIAARASSGKGRLAMCRNLVNPVHWAKRKQCQQENLEYEIATKEYNAQKGKDLGIEKPEKPPVRMHIIPANNTSAGFLQLLADNDGQGLIIETEGDTMVKTLKSEMGDISDFLRKGFHHEVISGYRKTDHDHSEVERPRFNMILSSTFGQLVQLIPSTENGLSSRFMFYYMNLKPVWKDVFAHSNQKSLNQHFNELGQEFYSLYCSLRENDPIEFSLTDSQQQEFNTFFAQMQDKYLVLQGLDYMAIVRRLGLIAFRIMMILTAMRIPETGDFSVKQECLDDDFQTTLSIIRIMVRHASYIVSQLPAEVKTEKRGNKKEKFFEGLGEKFKTKEFIELAKEFSIPERTAKRYIATFCDKGLLCREDTGVYFKPNYMEKQ